jgi:hypothetical protein
MIPAPRNFGFENMTNVLSVLPPALLAAVVLTVLYILYIEKIEPWAREKNASRSKKKHSPTGAFAWWKVVSYLGTTWHDLGGTTSKNALKSRAKTSRTRA